MSSAADAPSAVVEVRTVSDPVALKALADPLRLQILQLLSSDADRLWTVKELAAELRQPATKLYHHMKLIEGAGLVHDAETRLVSGIVEHRYRCAQRSIKLDDSLFQAPAMREESLRTVVGLLDTVRDDLIGYATSNAADVARISVQRALVRLSDDEHAEVMARLEQVIDDVTRRSRGRKRTGVPRSSITIVMHPTVSERER